MAIEQKLPPIGPESINPDDEAMAEILLQHEQRLGYITDNHEQSVAEVQGKYEAHLAETGPEGAHDLFRRMENSTAHVLRQTPGHVANEIASTAMELMETLPKEDKDLLQGEVAEQIRMYGLGEYVRAKRKLKKGSSKTAKRAIRTILDSRVAGNVQDRVESFGVNSSYVHESVELGSSPAVKKALRLSLNAQKLDRIRHEAAGSGVGSSFVDSALRHVEPDADRKLMELSLNGMVLAEAEYQGERWPINNGYVTEKIRRGTSRQEQLLISRTLAEQADATGKLSGHRSDEPSPTVPRSIFWIPQPTCRLRTKASRYLSWCISKANWNTANTT